MVSTIKQVLIGVSVCAGMGSIASSPAFAKPVVALPATSSITDVSISGDASYLTYDADSVNTFTVSNTPESLAKVLGGDLYSPTGNVELFSNSETLSNSAYASYKGVSSLSGKIGGRDITLSSLTIADWMSSVGDKTLGRAWFDDAVDKNGFGSLLTTATRTALFNAFSTYGGFQRFSDPNISYVNQDNTTGMISIGLAGHMNAAPLFQKSLDALLADKNVPTATKNLVKPFYGALSIMTLQASELVKYTYNGQSGYLYSFKGASSGLVEKGDKLSHTATYEVSFEGVVPEQPPSNQQAVPEPSTLLGLVGLGGFLAARKRKQAQQA